MPTEGNRRAKRKDGVSMKTGQEEAAKRNKQKMEGWKEEWKGQDVF